MKMRKYLSVIILLLTCSACTAGRFETLDNQMNTWIGRSMEELYINWGSPTSIQKLADERQVIWYSYKSEHGAEKTLVCNVRFIVKDNTIAETYYDGNLGACEEFIRAAPGSKY